MCQSVHPDGSTCSVPDTKAPVRARVWEFGSEECSFSIRPYQSQPPGLHPYLLERDATRTLLPSSFSKGIHDICNTLQSFQRNVVYIK